jgi:tetratricopeptide (TPR) repeat protein
VADGGRSTRWTEAAARLPGDRGLLAAAWLAALFLVAPSIAWYDDAEFVSAAFCLGVPHPTGFPLYNVLARAAQLVPVGSVPFRTHLLSLLAAFCAVLLATRLLRRAGVAVVPSLALLLGVLVLATRTLFVHAATAEVYLPSLLLVMLGVSLAVDAASDARRIVLLAFVTGLAGAHHAAAALILGALLLVSVCVGRRRLGLAGLALLPLAGVVGLLALGYLPLRAAAEPFRNWGDPRTWTAFVEHVTGARIARSFAEVGQVSWQVLEVRVQLLWRVVGDDLGLVAALVPLGAVLLALRASGRRLLGLLALAVLVDLGFTLGLNPMGIADRQTVVFSLFAALVLAVVPLAALARRLSGLPVARRVLLLTLPALPLGLAPDALYEADLGRDVHALALAQRAFELVPPGSVLLTSSDHLSAGALYLQGVEGFRLDTTHVVAAHVVESSHLRTLGRLHRVDGFPASLLRLADQLDRHPELREVRKVQLQALDALIGVGTNGPAVFWEPGLTEYEKALFERPPVGFPVAPVEGRGADVGHAFHAFLAAARSHVSRESAGALSTWLSQAATAAARLDDGPTAARLLAEALAQDPENPKALVNSGALLARAGRLSEAITLTEQALALRPDSVLALLNLARYRVAAGQAVEALPLLERAEALDPSQPTRARAAEIRRGDSTSPDAGTGKAPEGAVQ